MSKKVLIVASSGQYVQMFADRGWVVTTNKDMLDQVDLVCFTGGEDVSPHLYGEKLHPTTHSSILRDAYEKSVFEQAVSLEIPCVGICRGGQFLNVMNGGKMYQHVSEHVMDHEITVHDNDAPHNKVMASSTHHQMMRPGPSYVLLASANLGGYKQYMNGGEVAEDSGGEDVESVFYPNTKSLCFQPHPEFYGYAALKDTFFHLINKFCV